MGYGRYGKLADYVMDRMDESGKFEEFRYTFIDEGSEGVVYQITEDFSDVVRVMKISNQFNDYGDRMYLYDQEVLEVVNKLNVPYVVRMFDRGEFYVVNEYVDGISLEEESIECGVDEAWLEGVLDQLAELVSHLSTYGMRLYDLGPHNILVKEDMSWVVVDVGSVDRVTEIISKEDALIGVVYEYEEFLDEIS